ncbi:hypothetical protein T492DRAFT_916550 [Pavlovales sp. CCMP2436]|nr:hypothetical protein T492DRAFT_916550 [Pavlovales sp. CCMP2436]
MKVLVCALAGDILNSDGNTISSPLASYAEYRAEVAGAEYEDLTQLLTLQREVELRMLFALRAASLAEAYLLVFSPAERCEYSLADFEGDARDFEPELAQEGARWGADEAVRFLRAMQVCEHLLETAKSVHADGAQLAPHPNHQVLGAEFEVAETVHAALVPGCAAD